VVAAEDSVAASGEFTASGGNETAVRAILSPVYRLLAADIMC